MNALDWLMSPISGATDHDLSSGTYLHGRLMVLAWGILVPVAILLSRFYKVTPGQEARSEHAHPDTPARKSHATTPAGRVHRGAAKPAERSGAFMIPDRSVLPDSL